MGFIGVYFIDCYWSSLYELRVFKNFAKKSFILMSHISLKILIRVLTKSNSGYKHEFSLHLERTELQIISFIITGLNIFL